MPIFGFAFLFVFIFVIVVVWTALRRKTPRRRKGSLHPRYFYIILIGSSLIIPSFVQDQNWAMLAIWMFMIGSVGYDTFLKEQTPQDIATNYGEDPDHCGKCEYDLTGNVSKTCPECGWSIPDEPPPWERSHVWLWWKQWEIDYLADPRKRLKDMIFNATMFLGLVIWFIVQGEFVGYAILPVFLCLNMVINAVRIVAYSRREKVFDTS